MRVVIDRQVDQSIHDFYWASMWLYMMLFTACCTTTKSYSDVRDGREMVTRWSRK